MLALREQPLNGVPATPRPKDPAAWRQGTGPKSLCSEAHQNADLLVSQGCSPLPRGRAPIVVVAPVDSGGTPWGCAFPHLHRTHLIPLRSERAPVIVWLEDAASERFRFKAPQGRRVDLPALRGTVTTARDDVENNWLRWCAARGWIAYSSNQGTVTLYAGTPNEFVRKLPTGTTIPECLLVDPRTNPCRLDVPLNTITWRG